VNFDNVGSVTEILCYDSRRKARQVIARQGFQVHGTHAGERTILRKIWEPTGRDIGKLCEHTMWVSK
jgi:hypothetical protein